MISRARKFGPKPRVLLPAQVRKRRDIARSMGGGLDSGMLCPKCGYGTGVTDSRHLKNGTIRRRRVCLKGHRSTTIEKLVTA